MYWCLLLVVVLWLNRAYTDPSHVILDTDPGIDDAMAILTILRDPTVTVDAITVVRGNTDVPSGVINLYKTLYAADKLEIPVYKGSDSGLVSSPPSDNFFGQDGFGDLGDQLTYDPSWITKVQAEHAANFLARIVSEKPGQITIVAIGPLTNLALALHLNPKFLNQVRKVVVLGGTIRGSGNVAPGIEFNFYADPDAASVVLSRAEFSNTSITLIPMETVVATDLGIGWRLKVLGKIKNKAVGFLDKLEAKQRELHPWAAKSYTPYDTYAVVSLVNPASVKSRKNLYGSVETRGLKTRGLLLIDYLNLRKKRPNLDVVISMNRDEMRKTIIQDLSSYSK